MNPLDLLLPLAVLAGWLLLSPCSPWTVWRGGTCTRRTPSRPPEEPPTRPRD